MLIDLEESTWCGGPPYRSAVCIAGAGAAGLVLATALAERGIDVHLLEAGGRSDEGRSQEIYNAQMAGTKHAGTTAGRFRVFGGSSTRWGGQMLPYSADVFSPPAALSSRCWPLTPAALEPFYRRIEEILGTNHLPFTTELYSSLGMAVPAGFDRNPDLLLRFSKWAPFSHRNLAQTLGERAVASDKITVFLHANVTECLLSRDGSKAEAFLVRNYRGERFRFEARQYAIAMGTIETSRLLLASQTVCAKGVGNQCDQVGRGLHDHLSAPVALLAGEARHKLLSWLGPFVVGKTTHAGRLEASTALRERLGILAVQTHFTIEEPEDSGISVTRHLLRSMQKGEFPSALVGSLPRLPAASWDIVRLMYAAKFRRRRAVSEKATVPLQILCEQRARPENRIGLAGNERDALGMLKAMVDWRIDSEEIRSMLLYAGWLRGEFARLGVGPVVWQVDLSGNTSQSLPDIRDTNHPMGGTIMGDDPANSVVDANLKVHGLPNLSIASCSTFPTGGSSNPTFTLMALTLRLAERLKLTLVTSAPQLEISKPTHAEESCPRGFG